MKQKLKKIHIIGAPGTGKSWLAGKLSASLQLPHILLDDVFWQDNSYSTKRSPQERDELLRQILKSDIYILEGVYYSWLATSFTEADVVIVLTANVLLRDWRILKRWFSRLIFSNQRAEKLSSLLNLLIWNHKYTRKNLPAAYKLIKKSSKRILVGRSSSILSQLINYH
jgi:adenylate kinase family enzyme